MRFLPRSASWDEEMEKRSRRRIRDLVAHPASQGLDANENRCPRISMMARSANAPLKGRIQKRKTNNLQIITSGLQRTAGPYRGANSDRMHCSKTHRHSIASSARASTVGRISRPSAFVVLRLIVAMLRPPRVGTDRTRG